MEMKLNGKPVDRQAAPAHSRRAVDPGAAAATRERFLNVVAYDGTKEMPGHIKR
jgi:hypothetical protein